MGGRLQVTVFRAASAAARTAAQWSAPCAAALPEALAQAPEGAADPPLRMYGPLGPRVPAGPLGPCDPQGSPGLPGSPGPVDAPKALGPPDDDRTRLT